MNGKRIVRQLLVAVTIIGVLMVTPALASETTISGMIEQGDHGIVLSADDGDTYLVEGQDLSAMVGKSVKATGTLSEGAEGKMITITKVEEIKEVND